MNRGYKEAIQLDYTASLLEGYNAGFKETFHAKLDENALNGKLFALSILTKDEEVRIMNLSRNQERFASDVENSDAEFTVDDVAEIIGKLESDVNQSKDEENAI